MSDRLYHQLREHLAYLKLGAVAEQLAGALEAAERDKPGYTRFLHDLLAVEVAATEQRRLDGRLQFASFPAHKTLEQFDFDAQPTLDRRLVDELANSSPRRQAGARGLEGRGASSLVMLELP
ncbi:MAG: ATP-binding protein [Actinobacteria bacterium]|nr:ATP-binding protein [Actinomycetota bacterium]